MDSSFEFIDIFTGEPFDMDVACNRAKAAFPQFFHYGGMSKQTNTMTFGTRFGPPDPRATILFACSLCARLLGSPSRLFCLLVRLDRGFLGRCSVFFVSSFILSSVFKAWRASRRSARATCRHCAPAVGVLSRLRLSCLFCHNKVKSWLPREELLECA